MLCFEVWKNSEKLTTAGLSETGVVSFTLTWVGKEPITSTVAAEAKGNIPGVRLRVGGLEGMTHFEWLWSEDLAMNDELRIRLISAPSSDPPLKTETAPRGRPGWNKK